MTCYSCKSCLAYRIWSWMRYKCTQHVELRKLAL